MRRGAAVHAGPDAVYRHRRCAELARDCPPRWRRRHARPPSRSPSRLALWAGTHKTSGPRCISASWKRCRTSPSTRRPWLPASSITLEASGQDRIRQQQTAATTLPPSAHHHPASALRPAQMTAVDLPVTRSRRGDHRVCRASRWDSPLLPAPMQALQRPRIPCVTESC
jgi:hypothetical protein